MDSRDFPSRTDSTQSNRQMYTWIKARDVKKGNEIKSKLFRGNHPARKGEVSFISYVLRFSDRIDRMKNPYGNFFIQSQLRNDFLTRGKISCQNESISSQSVHAVVAPLQSSFTEVCGVSRSLHWFSRKLVI